jgi:phytoene dehydrogenase-like protein
LLAGGRIAGVELAAGERLEAPLVLSSLSHRDTLALAPAAARGLGAAQRLGPAVPAGVSLVFGLARQTADALLQPGHRNIVAEKPDAYAAALAAARLGKLPDEPLLELSLPPQAAAVDAPASRVRLHVRAWPIPPDYLVERDAVSRVVAAAVERVAPGFSQRIASCDLLPPRDSEPPSVARLCASAEERIRTAIPGLFLSGRAAEPADAVSCRAARQAARLAIAHRSEPR